MKKCYKTVLKAASFLMVITVVVSLHQMQTYASETSVTALNNKHDNRNITTVNIYNAMDQLQKLHNDNIVVVDIRHPLHYKPYHLKNSKNMPLELLTLGVLSGSFDGKQIMVITDPMVDTIDSPDISTTVLETLNILNQVVDGTNIDTLSMIQMLPDVLTQLQKIYLDMAVVKDKNSDKQLSILYDNIYNKWQTMINMIPSNLVFNSKF